MSQHWSYKRAKRIRQTISSAVG